MLECGFVLKSFLMAELSIACSKFHFRKDLCYIETSQQIDSVNHLTVFHLILPFTEKIMFEQSLIYYIRLNVIFVNFNPAQILFH